MVSWIKSDASGRQFGGLPLRHYALRAAFSLLPQSLRCAIAEKRRIEIPSQLLYTVFGMISLQSSGSLSLAEEERRLQSNKIGIDPTFFRRELLNDPPNL